MKQDSLQYNLCGSHNESKTKHILIQLKGQHPTLFDLSTSMQPNLINSIYANHNTSYNIHISLSSKKYKNLVKTLSTP